MVLLWQTSKLVFFMAGVATNWWNFWQIVTFFLSHKFVANGWWRNQTNCPPLSWTVYSYVKLSPIHIQNFLIWISDKSGDASQPQLSLQTSQTGIDKDDGENDDNIDKVCERAFYAHAVKNPGETWKNST